MKPSLSKLPWLEIALGLTTLSLVAQLFPGPAAAAGSFLLGLLDVREWSRTTWFVANLLFVALLVGVRFAPALKVGPWVERVAEAFRFRNRLSRKERAAFKAKLEERQLARELAEVRKHR
jgi:hypothetical protein